jgi:hypothetical protein
MYSVQTGHSSSLKSTALNPGNRLVILERTGSENRIFEMDTLRKQSLFTVTIIRNTQKHCVWVEYAVLVC